MNDISYKSMITLMYISRRTWVESNENWNLYKSRMEKIGNPFLKKFNEKLQSTVIIYFLIGIGREDLDTIFKNEPYWNYE